MKETKLYKAVNWNEPSKDYTEIFWNQNLRQMWIDTEYVPSRDVEVWKSLEPEFKEVYRKVLGGLTLLDTVQSNTGMPLLMEGVNDLQCKAIMGFMTMMESIHAKSYSTIFSTVCSKEEITNTFKWVEENQYLQYKADTVSKYYKNAYENSNDNYIMYIGLSVSVLLESFLFYSGFFFPLWLSGQGKMVASADIIKKIIADESIHGVFIGLLAQEFYQKLTPNEQGNATVELYSIIINLLQNELKYTNELYGPINLTSEVKEYIRYNVNKALQNLGNEPVYQNVKINQLVQNGLDNASSKTTQHDFFSKKSTNYEMAINIEHLRDEDFIFNDLNEK